MLRTLHTSLGIVSLDMQTLLSNDNHPHIENPDRIRLLLVQLANRRKVQVIFYNIYFCVQ